MSAVPQANVGQPSQPLTDQQVAALPQNGSLVPAPSGVNIQGLQWRAWHVKSMDPQTEKQKVVGVAIVPEFDEKNPQAGLQQIVDFPWHDEELSGGMAYSNYMEAIVKTMNTQHGTNVRNRIRQANSGRISSQEIKVKAMERIPPQEMQAAMQQGGLAIVQLMDRYEKIVREEMKSQKGGANGGQQAVA